MEQKKGQILQSQNHHYQEEEITLKEIILKSREYFFEIWTNRKWVLLVSIVFGGWFFIRTYIAPVTFSATLTFMVNEDERGGGGGGAIAGILGQFGFGGGGSEFNLDKILTLARSRKIIGDAIFHQATIDGKKDYLANHIIRIYDFHEEWKDSEIGLKDFLFKSSNIEEFNQLENIVYMALVGTVAGNLNEGVLGLFTNFYNEDTGIMEFTVTGESETLSIELVKNIYSTLSNFYIEKSIERQQQTYNLMRVKVDSLEQVINSKTFEYLKFKDSYKGLSLQQYEAREVKLQMDIQVMTVAFGESLKNLEIADFSLKNSTPFFQTIDEPLAPLSSSFSLGGLIKQLILGGVLGGFLTVLLIIGRVILSGIMA